MVCKITHYIGVKDNFWKSLTSVNLAVGTALMARNARSKGQSTALLHALPAMGHHFCNSFQEGGTTFSRCLTKKS